jgi:hypothetical protein
MLYRLEVITQSKFKFLAERSETRHLWADLPSPFFIFAFVPSAASRELVDGIFL